LSSKYLTQKNFKNFPTKSTFIHAKTQHQFFDIMKHEESDSDRGSGLDLLGFIAILFGIIWIISVIVFILRDF